MVQLFKFICLLVIADFSIKVQSMPTISTAERPLLLSFGYRPQVPEVQFLTGEFVELKKRAACYGSCPGRGQKYQGRSCLNKYQCQNSLEVSSETTNSNDKNSKNSKKN